MHFGRTKFTYVFLELLILQICWTQVLTVNGDPEVFSIPADSGGDSIVQSHKSDISTHNRVKRDVDQCSVGNGIKSLAVGKSCKTQEISKWFSSAHRPNTLVHNFGISMINAKYCVGYSFWWTSCPIKQYNIPSGYFAIVTEPEDQTRFASAIIVTNLNASRAIFDVSYENSLEFSVSTTKGPWDVDFNFDKNGVQLLLDISMNSNQNPSTAIYQSLVQIVDTFWPRTNVDITRIEQNNLLHICHDKDCNKVKEYLNKYLTKLENVMKSIVKSGPVCSCTNPDFQDVLIILSELDVNTIFQTRFETFYGTLPLYSRIVNIILTIYTFIINNDLINEQIFVSDMLIKERQRIVEFAKKYLKYIEKYSLKLQYDYGTTYNMYNDFMYKRTFLAINGLEYLPFWEFISSELHNKTLQTPTLAYSIAFGEITYDMNYYMLRSNLALDINTVVKNNIERRKRISAIDFEFIGPKNDKLYKVYVIYEKNRDRKFLTSRALRLHGATIKKIVVGGQRTVQYIIFTLSDDRTYRVGDQDTKQNVPSLVFELLHHHIAGILTVNSKSELRSISVSFTLDDLIDWDKPKLL